MPGLGEVRRRGESYVAAWQMFWTDSCDGLRIGMVRGESLRDEGRVGASLSEKKIHVGVGLKDGGIYLRIGTLKTCEKKRFVRQ